MMLDEADNEIIERGHVFGEKGVAHTSCVFVQGLISSVVEAILNVPILADEVVQAVGVGFLLGKAGDAVHDVVAQFTGCGDYSSALEFEDLSCAGPVQIVGQHAGCGECSFFPATVSFVDGACGLEIFGYGAETLDARFRFKPFFDIAAQLRLVVFGEPDVIATRRRDLYRYLALRVHRITHHDAIAQVHAGYHARSGYNLIFLPLHRHLRQNDTFVRQIGSQ